MAVSTIQDGPGRTASIPQSLRGIVLEAKVLTICRLTSATGRNVEHVRSYEASRILPSASRDSSYRSYGRARLNRLGFIRWARGLSLSLDLVKTLLKHSDDRSQSCAVDDIAKRQREKVERTISDLQALRAEFDWIIESLSPERSVGISP